MPQYLTDVEIKVPLLIYFILWCSKIIVSSFFFICFMFNEILVAFISNAIYSLSLISDRYGEFLLSVKVLTLQIFKN